MIEAGQQVVYGGEAFQVSHRVRAGVWMLLSLVGGDWILATTEDLLRG